MARKKTSTVVSAPDHALVGLDSMGRESIRTLVFFLRQVFASNSAAMEIASRSAVLAIDGNDLKNDKGDTVRLLGARRDEIEYTVNEVNEPDLAEAAVEASSKDEPVEEDEPLVEADPTEE